MHEQDTPLGHDISGDKHGSAIVQLCKFLDDVPPWDEEFATEQQARLDAARDMQRQLEKRAACAKEELDHAQQARRDAELAVHDCEEAMRQTESLARIIAKHPGASQEPPASGSRNEGGGTRASAALWLSFGQTATNQDRAALALAKEKLELATMQVQRAKDKSIGAQMDLAKQMKQVASQQQEVDKNEQRLRLADTVDWRRAD
jgi:hypothetical protein